jgi:hypothetical protein
MTPFFYHQDVTRRALLLAVVLLAANLAAQTLEPVDVPASIHSARTAWTRSAKEAPQALGAAAAPEEMVARVVCGDGWETVIVLLNMGNAPVVFRQFFMDAEGMPMRVALRAYPDRDGVTAVAAGGSLNPGTRLSVAVSAVDGPQREGWAVIASAAPGNTLAGYTIVRRRGRSNGIYSETTLALSSMQDYSVYLPFDNTEGFRTHLTLVNPASNLPAETRLTYLGFTGEVLLIDSLVVNPGQQTTIVIPDVYPDLANKVGTVFVEANLNRFSAFGLRYNESSGVVAALPSLAPSLTPSWAYSAR